MNKREILKAVREFTQTHQLRDVKILSEKRGEVIARLEWIDHEALTDEMRDQVVMTAEDQKLRAKIGCTQAIVYKVLAGGIPPEDVSRLREKTCREIDSQPVDDLTVNKVTNKGRAIEREIVVTSYTWRGNFTIFWLSSSPLDSGLYDQGGGFEINKHYSDISKKEFEKHLNQAYQKIRQHKAFEFISGQ